MLKDKSVGPNQKDSATTPKDSASTRISTVEQPGASVQPGAPEKKPAPPVQQPVASVQPSAPEEESAPPVQQPVASVEPVAPSDSGKSNTKKNPGYLERMANTAANIFNPVYEAIIKPFYKIMIAPVVNFVSSLWNKATGGKEKSPSAVQTSEPTSSNGSVSPVTSVPDSVPNITLREKSVGPVSSFMKGESAAVLEDTRPSSNNDVSPPSVKK